MKRSKQQFEDARWARVAAGDSAYCFLVDANGRRRGLFKTLPNGCLRAG